MFQKIDSPNTMTAAEIRTKIADAKLRGENTYFLRETDSTPLRIIEARTNHGRVEVRALNTGLWFALNSGKIYNA